MGFLGSPDKIRRTRTETPARTRIQSRGYRSGFSKGGSNQVQGRDELVGLGSSQHMWLETRFLQ